jgi:DNA-binding response OmpR family regulator
MANSKILIVDDDPNLSRLLAVILNRVGGYEVYEENRPFAALATARQFRPDLVLLDVDMPGKDGGTVAREIKRDLTLAKTPVIFVTSLISASEAGVHSGERYLSKPVDPKLLLDTVSGMCRRYKSGALVAQVTAS